MPNSWSFASQAKRSTCDTRLQQVFDAVLQIHDCTWVCGARSEQDQNEAFRTGHSKKQWPDSKHNCPDGRPSIAADVAPCVAGVGIPWADRERFVLFVGVVLGVAGTMGIEIRSGADWDRDMDTSETSFFDAAHFELVE